MISMLEAGELDCVIGPAVSQVPGVRMTPWRESRCTWPAAPITAWRSRPRSPSGSSPASGSSRSPRVDGPPAERRRVRRRGHTALRRLRGRRLGAVPRTGQRGRRHRLRPGRRDQPSRTPARRPAAAHPPRGQLTSTGKPTQPANPEVARLPVRSRRDHLTARWTPSMTAATQPTPAATQARLYRAKLPCRPWTPAQRPPRPRTSATTASAPARTERKDQRPWMQPAKMPSPRPWRSRGPPFAHREAGPATGDPVVFLHHSGVRASRTQRCRRSTSPVRPHSHANVSF